MKNLKCAYKRLNIDEYKGIIKDTMVPFFDAYDGEFITILTPNTTITIERHYYNDCFMGFNILANGKLLITMGSRKEAREYVKSLQS